MRRWYDGLEIFLGVAAVFAFLGVLAVLIAVQSPSFVQWTGIKVHGVSRGGVVSYSYRGEQFTTENRTDSPDDRTSKQVTVWLPRGDPADSSRAYVESGATRWLDFSFVAVWFAVAAGIVAGGWIRRRRRFL